jgi:hypothetical protein
VLDLDSLLGRIRDRRIQPRIPTGVVARSVLGLFLARLGSLNALEQTRFSRFWRQWLGAAMPSADSIGRITACTEPDSVREAHQDLCTRLKRHKALQPTTHGLMALVLDGHESHSTYKRRCSGCLERKVKTKKGTRIQYYHRSVTAMLLGHQFPLLLDAEPIKPGEDELAAATRLLKRVLKHYPRAFESSWGMRCTPMLGSSTWFSITARTFSAS